MDHVIHYDLPTDKDGFIQRSGRTGRVKNGVAMSFYLEDENRQMAAEIASVIKENGQEPPAFLMDNVQQSDYNFGEPEDEEDAEANGNQNNDNGNDDWGTTDNSSAPYHAQQQREASNHEEEGTEAPPQQPPAAVIQDSTADSDWD